MSRRRTSTSGGQSARGRARLPGLHHSIDALQACTKETKNTIRYAEGAEKRRPIVGTVYVDKYKLPKPYPEKIRVTIELLE